MISIRNNRYLIARRIIQLLFLLLFMASNYLGLKILQGNYSTAYVFEAFYLSDPHAFLQMIFAGFIAGIDMIIGVVIVFMFYLLIGGRAFCSWVCPVNIISDLALFLRKKIKIDKDLVGYSRNARYYILGLGLILSAIMATSAFELVNPITIIQRGLIFGLGSGLSVAVLILAFSLFVNRRGWCASLCPLGAFYSIITRINIIKVYHKAVNCTDCGNCLEVCPEVQVLTGVINERDSFIHGGECTNCGRCVENCFDNALRFRINKLKYK